MASDAPTTTTPPPRDKAYGSTNVEDDSNDDAPPLSFADLGIPTGPQLQDTVTGKVRRWGDISKLEVVYLFTSGIALIATIAFTVYKLATLDKTQPDFVFAIVIILNAGFCSFYLVHGMFKERPSEIFILVAATVVIVIYLITNYIISLDKGSVKLTRLIVACVFGPPMVVMGLLIGRGYVSSGRLIFRTVGANTSLQTSCKVMYIFLDLIKFDLQLGMTMVVLILTNAANIDTLDIVVLSVGVFVTIGWFVMGHLAVRYESKVMTYIFWALSPAELAYIIYKTIRAADRLKIAKALAAVSISAGVLAACVRILVIILTFIVYRNFGKGLKEKAFEVN